MSFKSGIFLFVLVCGIGYCKYFSPSPRTQARSNKCVKLNCSYPLSSIHPSIHRPSHPSISPSPILPFIHPPPPSVPSINPSLFVCLFLLSFPHLFIYLSIYSCIIVFYYKSLFLFFIVLLLLNRCRYGL